MPLDFIIKDLRDMGFLDDGLDPSPGQWQGFPREARLPFPLRPDVDQLRASCAEMGLVTCTCRPVERGGERILLRVPSCPVHKTFDRLR